jgi:hypothetical protein
MTMFHGVTYNRTFHILFVGIFIFSLHSIFHSPSSTGSIDIVMYISWDRHFLLHSTNVCINTCMFLENEDKKNLLSINCKEFVEQLSDYCRLNKGFFLFWFIQVHLIKNNILWGYMVLQRRKYKADYFSALISLPLFPYPLNIRVLHNELRFEHYPLSYFYLNNNSETGFCLRPQIKSLLRWTQSIRLERRQGDGYVQKVNHFNNVPW